MMQKTPNSAFWLLLVQIILTLHLVSSMSTPQKWTRNNTAIIITKPQDSLKSRAINSNRPFDQEEADNSPFEKSHWTIWDRPEDQLAVEEGGGSFQMNKPTRKRKQYNVPITPSSYSNGRGHGTQRQGCNSNVQVTLFPVILVLIAGISLIITVLIFWLIARKWTEFGTSKEPSMTGHDYDGSGWSSGRSSANESGFSRVLKNMDFDQLTTLVTNGIETYRKYVEKS